MNNPVYICLQGGCRRKFNSNDLGYAEIERKRCWGKNLSLNSNTCGTRSVVELTALSDIFCTTDLFSVQNFRSSNGQNRDLA